jgi:hypothetical protein
MPQKISNLRKWTAIILAWTCTGAVARAHGEGLLEAFSFLGGHVIALLLVFVWIFVWPERLRFRLAVLACAFFSFFLSALFGAAFLPAHSDASLYSLAKCGVVGLCGPIMTTIVAYLYLRRKRRIQT